LCDEGNNNFGFVKLLFYIILQNVIGQTNKKIAYVRVRNSHFFCGKVLDSKRGGKNKDDCV